MDVWVAQLRHPFRTGNAPQFVPAEISQPGVRRQRVEDQFFSGSREDRLSTVGEIADPPCPVDGRADVVALVAQEHFPGVHADA